MDHRRIEWLFLIIFSLVSIYLGFEILHSPISLSNSNNNGVTDIRSEMRTDNITIPKVSDQPGSGFYLAAKDSDYLEAANSLSGVDSHYSKENKMITASPKSQVEVSSDPKTALQQVTAFKNDADNVAYGKHYVYEPDLSSDQSYVFVQKTDYGNIYDNKAQLIINLKDNHIDTYTQTYLGPVRPVRELQSTISSWRAVQAMYTDRQLTSNSRIIKLNLAYSKLTTVRGSNILLPTWIAWVESKNTKNISIKRINAFTGQVLQPNAYNNVEK
jgi:regulatory protein YycI of two-component signal transduction system YycFG